MKAQPPLMEAGHLFKDIQRPLDKEDSAHALPTTPEETVDSEARTARNVVIWTLSAFVAFWVMLFAAYVLIW